MLKVTQDTNNAELGNTEASAAYRKRAEFGNDALLI
jgi:hypothetical protein